MRLDKYLCDMGMGTRSQIKEGIRKGFAQIDDQIVNRPETQVSDDNQVYWQGVPVSYVTLEYYMLHKPAGVLSATEDKKQQTVLDLIHSKKRKDLSPVGRLDKDTEGLLLITNDGMLTHHLLSPKHHVEKVYYARLEGECRDEFIPLFAQGLDIGDEKPTLPAKLEIINSNEIYLTICEGRFHQVKRMFEAVGCHVTYLKRISMGPLVLDESLSPGQYRALTEEEILQLKEC